MWTLATMLADRAQAHPETLYVACVRRGHETTSLTYGETWRLACRWAALFTSCGLGKGDRVMLLLPNSEDFVGAFYGAIVAGGVPTAIPPVRGVAAAGGMIVALFDRVRSLGARVVVVPGSLDQAAKALQGTFSGGPAIVSAQDLPESSPELTPAGSADDLALLQITSGTSGPARAVQLQQRAVLAQMEAIAGALAIDGTLDSAVSWLPLFHDMGLIGFLLTPAFVGRHVFLLRTEEFAGRPGLWVQTLSATGATITGGPPSAYQLCARRTREEEADALDLSRVRIALVGAETVTAKALDTFATRFAASGFCRSSLMPTYGLAENGLAVTMPPLGRGPRFDSVDLEALETDSCAVGSTTVSRRSRSFAAVGSAIPGVEVAVVDHQRKRLEDRRVGEILVKGATVMAGYFQHPEATTEALRDGWLHTGDLGYMIDGELHITGRLKEVLIVGGRNYSPEDLELVVANLPGVRAGRVIALSTTDDTTSTELVVILAETGLTEPGARDQLQHDIRQRLAESGYPVDRVLLLPPRSILTTDSGKVARLPCREKFLESSTG